MDDRITLVFESQHEGGYTVTCEELPELITEGDTMVEALDNVKDALFAVIDLYEYRDREMPVSVW